jgi:glucose-1-phosphate adenylyltransferase
LNDHLEEGWNIFSDKLGHFLKVVPPQQRIGSDWYRGTADCIRQNIYLIERYRPQHILILSGDHIYKMDYGNFFDYHQKKEADITISLLEIDAGLANQVGLAGVDEDFRIQSFQEKPKKNIKTIPGDPKHVLASMGIYFFKTETLLKILNTTKEDDFGRDIIPHMLEDYRVHAYPYGKCNQIRDYITVISESGERHLELNDCMRDSSYWRDVGTLDQYWNANMDLTGVDPYFNLYGRMWPIHTHQKQLPPAKFIFSDERAKSPRVGKALDSLVGPGCIVSGIVRNSILSPGVIIGSWADVDESVIFDNVVVGRNCKIKKAVIDKDNDIPHHTEIGIRPKEDAKRFTVTQRGITVIPKGYFKSGK